MPASEPPPHAPGCPRCGTANEPASAYCYQCGLPLEDSGIESEPSHAGAEQQYAVAYHIPLWRVAVMTVLSAGLYLFYWFYLTWKQYRDSTDEEAYPVWHALTLFVPIYNLFRSHAHMRVFREMMDGRRIYTTISPVWAVIVIIVTHVLSYIDWNIPSVTQAQVQTSLAMSMASMVAILALLLHAQSNINRYWIHVYGRVDSLGFSLLELAVTVIGILLWTNLFVLIASESYRLSP